MSNSDKTERKTLPGLEPKEKIQILLSEYSALRSEIVSRTANGFTLTTIGVTVIAWLVKEFTLNSPWHYWFGALFILIVFGFGVFVNLRDISRAARRVKALEHEINSRAGEHLLIWETLSGAVTRKGGIIASFFSTIKPFPHSKLTPLQDLYSDGKEKRYDHGPEGQSQAPAELHSSNTDRITNKIALVRSLKFWTVLAAGVSLVGLQGFFAHADGYFSHRQILHVHNISNAYAFIEHGGMWADVFITTPIAAYIVCRYRLPYFSWPGLLVLVLALAFGTAAGLVYQEMGKTFPEAHTHFGHTPPAGWIHGLFAVAALWIIGMFYLTHTEPQRSNDIIVVSMGLTALLALGVMKFNPRWSWSTEALIQVALSATLLWIITAFWFGRHVERRGQPVKARSTEATTGNASTD
ncbi:MAG TPA: hypothetical protein VH988_32195 [Thermoanaerobaculia bacterium]|nr:hypothetical protein [Thermoanaerobaculia bacterium]